MMKHKLPPRLSAFKSSSKDFFNRRGTQRKEDAENRKERMAKNEK